MMTKSTVKPKIIVKPEIATHEIWRRQTGCRDRAMVTAVRWHVRARDDHHWPTDAVGISTYTSELAADFLQIAR